MVGQPLDFDPSFKFVDSLLRTRDENIEPLTDPYTQHAYAYACTKIIAQNIGGVPFKINKDPSFKSSDSRKAFLNKVSNFNCNYRDAETINSLTKQFTSEINKENRFKEIKSGPLVELFDAPSDEMVSVEFWTATLIHYINEGATFWILEGKKSENSVPISIEVTGPKNWTKELNERGKLVGWKYKREIPGGIPKEESYKLWQVVHFKNYNPVDKHKPLAWHKAAKLPLETDHEANVYNRTFFKNGAEAGVVLETEGKLNDEQRQLIINSWKSRHQGRGKGHKPVLLDSGLKAKLLRESHREMEFRLLKEVARDETLAAYQVPKSIVGVIDDVNRATFIGSKQNFFESTLIPLMNLIAEVVYNRFFKLIDPTLFGFFDLSLVEGLRGDTKDRAEIASFYHKMGVPFNVINSRFDLGFEDIEHGDYGFIGDATTEQIVSGQLLGPLDVTDPSEEEDSKPDNEDAEEPIEVNDDNKHFKDLFTINELVVAKKLIESLEQGTFKEDINIIKDSIFNIVAFDVDRESVEGKAILTHISKALSLIERKYNKYTEFDLIAKKRIQTNVATLSRSVTTTIVNFCLMLNIISADCTHKKWVTCKFCLDSNNYHSTLSGVEIPIQEKFTDLGYFPGDFNIKDKSFKNCQCSIKGTKK